MKIIIHITMTLHDITFGLKYITPLIVCKIYWERVGHFIQYSCYKEHI